jgi:hypothetical protein
MILLLPTSKMYCSNQFSFSCFPHVINIAVKAGLKALAQIPLFEDFNDHYDSEFMYGDTYPPPESSTIPLVPPELTMNPEYLEALERDIIGSICHYITACQSLGQRHEQFKTILKEGNKNGGWGDENEILRNVGLLKDVDTWWSATFIMLDHFLETYLVSISLFWLCACHKLTTV